MHENKLGTKIIKGLLIGISILFLFVMLILPLITVFSEAFKQGWEVYIKAITDEYTIKATILTLEATLIAVAVNTIFGVFAAWAITKFRFKGKKVLTTLIDLPVTVSPIIAGLIFILTFGRQSILYPLLQQADISIVYAVPGVVLATVFVTFPFISRELIPVLEAQGTDEEEAAALCGAKLPAKEALKKLCARCPGIVVLTLGEQGAYGALDSSVEFVPACAVKAVDATGAGDTFTGYLLWALSNGKGLAEAMETAAKAAALT